VKKSLLMQLKLEMWKSCKKNFTINSPVSAGGQVPGTGSQGLRDFLNKILMYFPFFPYFGKEKRD
jgi:hypothetical protein